MIFMLVISTPSPKPTSPRLPMILPNPKLIKIDWSHIPDNSTQSTHLVVPFCAVCAAYDDLASVKKPGRLRLACMTILSNIISSEVLTGTYAVVSMESVVDWKNAPQITYSINKSTSPSIVNVLCQFLLETSLRRGQEFTITSPE